jgi:lipoprotein-anchoring transpeptidase ErfK/SrfK
MRRLCAVLLTLLLLPACQVERTDPQQDPSADRANRGVATFGRYDTRATEDDLERTRQDTRWRDFRAAPSAEGQRARPAEPPRGALESAALDRYADSLRVPLSGDTEGRAVLYAQVLLDRAGFSPGQIDGLWGQNTEKAVYWFQEREGLSPTGTLDRETLGQLARWADAPDRPGALIATHTLTAEDVEGPFEPVPDDIYEQAERDRLGYESLGERLGERFHVSPATLRRLNGGRALDGLAAGDTLRVPDVRAGARADGGSVARLVVSDGGRYLHALDSDDRILYHFPATLGSDYDPSPTETLEVTSVTEDPEWYYQPSILAHVDDDDEAAVIPPGPNSAVGAVWIGLSKEHYGIHGTAEPGTIGYAASAGCVRLTNWDALFLAERVRPGVSVEFRDVDGRSDEGTSMEGTTGEGSSEVRPEGAASGETRPAPPAQRAPPVESR